MIYHMDSVLWHIIINKYTKDSSYKVLNKEKEFFNPIILFIKVNGIIISQLNREKYYLIIINFKEIG